MDLIEKLLELRKYPAQFPVQTLYIPDLKITDLERFIAQSCEDGLVKLIVVYETSSISKKKTTFYKTMCDLDIFEKKYLDLMLRGHRLVPLHEKLDAAARLHITQHYKENDLPLLSPSDPMAVLYDFKLGDIVKISRGRGPYFRLVKEF
jgi:DNA-directed RNA polymerase subunit H (RpoH/RPB5)